MVHTSPFLAAGEISPAGAPDSCRWQRHQRSGAMKAVSATSVPLLMQQSRLRRPMPEQYGSQVRLV